MSTLHKAVTYLFQVVPQRLALRLGQGRDIGEAEAAGRDDGGRVEVDNPDVPRDARGEVVALAREERGREADDERRGGEQELERACACELAHSWAI